MTSTRLCILSLVFLVALSGLAWPAPRARGPVILPGRLGTPPEQKSRDAWQQPERVLEALALKPGDTAADVGAGLGYFTWRLAGAVGPTGKVYAVDVDSRSIAYLKHQRAKRKIGWVEVGKGGYLSPRLPEGSVDAALICNTLHHIRSRAAYLVNLRRTLAPRGRLVLVEFKKVREKQGPSIEHRMAAETAIELADKAGWKAVARLDLPRQWLLVLQPNGREVSRPR